MKVGSLFTGIGGFDLAALRIGCEVVWQSEIEPFCHKVLETRFPDAKRFGDIRELGKHNLDPVDLICAGFPCQDVSVAGKRAGLAGARTGLFFEAARILQEIRPTWFLFENVPGLLSSNKGRDFGEVLRVLMVECGYGICWRVCDSQFFGVAQRRRRVFVVGCLGKPCPPEVLFESARRQRHSESSRETGKDVAFALAASVRGTGDGHGQGWNTTYVTETNSSQTDAYGVRDFAGLPKGLDSARYRALGNAVTVNSVQWIINRIKIASNQLTTVSRQNIGSMPSSYIS
jgi:DNA (cytosine-5)-methyltransferase 1